MACISTLLSLIMSHTSVFRLGLSIIINSVIVIFELGAGFLTGSLSLLSDAIHNLADVASLVLSFWSERLKTRKPTGRKTYGFKRAEVLTAFVNALILVLVTVLIGKEAILRLFHPSVLSGETIGIVATVALIGNSAAALLLRRHAHDNLNLRGAWLHTLQDALFSLVVIAAAFLMRWLHWYALDPILSLLLSVFILCEAYRLLREAVHILMESVPFDINVGDVRTAIQALPSVQSLHDLHVWQTDSESRFLSIHVVTNAIDDCSRKRLLGAIQKLMAEHFKIGHTTIQMVGPETENDDPLTCEHCN